MGSNPVVKVGQQWADNDPRAEGRVLEVESITPFIESGPNARNWVLARVVSDRKGISKSQIGRKVRISLARMRPTKSGYRLVKDVNPDEQSDSE